MEFKGKKENKTIRHFCSIPRTIDGLARNPEDIKEYLDNYRKLEQVLGGKMETIFTTMYDCGHTKGYVKYFKKAFSNEKMEDRIAGCICEDGMLDSDENLIKSCKHVGKLVMVKDYEENHEKNKNDVKFCLYAGDNWTDRDMALGQSRGEYYKNLPGAFIDAGFYPNSYIFHNGKKEMFKCDDESSCLRNYEALSKGYEYISELIKTKGLEYFANLGSERSGNEK